MEIWLNFSLVTNVISLKIAFDGKLCNNTPYMPEFIAIVIYDLVAFEMAKAN